MRKGYYEMQEEIREQAIDWQLNFADQDYSWADIADCTNYFETMGRRFGLLGEFRENGII